MILSRINGKFTHFSHSDDIICDIYKVVSVSIPEKNKQISPPFLLDLSV